MDSWIHSIMDGRGLQHKAVLFAIDLLIFVLFTPIPCLQSQCFVNCLHMYVGYNVNESKCEVMMLSGSEGYSVSQGGFEHLGFTLQSSPAQLFD